MLLGQYIYRMDSKNRLFIPSRFRAHKDAIVLTCGLEKCLFGFAKKEWDTLTQTLTALPLTKASARQFTRIFFSGAVECTPDRQGRVLVPSHLAVYACLAKNKDIIIIGVNTRLEIWNLAQWKTYAQKAHKTYETVAEQLVHNGI